MKFEIKNWLHALRLRTLPLALSCIGMGSVLSLYHGTHRPLVTLFALLTATLLQMLSNLANDYGDAQNGADLAGRIGPERMVASGRISLAQMKAAIWLFGVLSLVSGVGLIVIGLQGQSLSSMLGFLALGLVSIVAAITYTAGKKPYGYAGLGDVSVLLFFGFTAVLGTYYLHSHQLNWSLIWPALGMGGFSVAVLNLNNMRDRESDLAAGKKTIPARFGGQIARRYHSAIVIISILAIFGYSFFYGYKGLFFAAAFAGLLQLQTLSKVLKVVNLADYDPFLKQTALRTLLLTLLALLFYPFS